MEVVKYIAASKATKEVVWLRKCLKEPRVVLLVVQPMILFYDKSRVVAQSKKPRNHYKGKHIERKCHLIHEIIQRGDVVIRKIPFVDNLADFFTKRLIG